MVVGFSPWLPLTTHLTVFILWTASITFHQSWTRECHRIGPCFKWLRIFFQSTSISFTSDDVLLVTYLEVKCNSCNELHPKQVSLNREVRLSFYLAILSRWTFTRKSETFHTVRGILPILYGVAGYVRLLPTTFLSLDRQPFRVAKAIAKAPQSLSPHHRGHTLLRMLASLLLSWLLNAVVWSLWTLTLG
jgi:hypothetical protein